MFETSRDILNMSLAIGFGILVVFLCIFLFYAISVLRDVSRVSGSVKSLVERIHKTITEPLRALDYIVEKVKPYIESFIENRFSGKGKKK